jgi:hypothetical protein
MEGRPTLQICSLLLAEHSAHIADPRCQGNLEILCHDLLASIDVALLLCLAHHHLYALDSLLTLLKAPCDALSKLLDFALLLLLDVLIVESRQHVLLVQLVELPRLLRYLGEVLGDLVLHIQPPWRQQVHLNHRVAVIFIGTARHQPLPLLGHAPAVAEAIGARSAITRLLLRMVGVGLAIGYKAACYVSRNTPGWSDAAYRFVRSRHMLSWGASMPLCHGILKPGCVCEDTQRAMTVGSVNDGLSGCGAFADAGRSRLPVLGGARVPSQHTKQAV